MNRTGSLVTLLVISGAIAAFAQPAPPRPPRPPNNPPPESYFRGSFLGVGVAEIDLERSKELKLKEERGVEVKNLDEDSPASKAGVKVGDVVLEYNGQNVAGAEQFVRLVRETPVGRQVKLLISRNGSTQTLTATIGSRAPGKLFSEDIEEAMSKLGRMRLPDLPRPMMTMQSRAMGVETESLSSQLAEFFGVSEGVLVRSVLSGSAAEKAGVKAGDVITKVGDRKVSSPNEVANAVRSVTGASVPVTVVRNKKEMTLTITLDQKSSDRNRRSVVRMDLKTPI